LYYFPERRRIKKEKALEKRTLIFSLIREYMTNIYKLSTETNKTLRTRSFRKSIIDTEFLDETIRTHVTFKIKPSGTKDELANFFKSSQDIAKEFQEGNAITMEDLKGWIQDYRILCNVITGEWNLPVSFEM
jgi:hypothetical protein